MSEKYNGWTNRETWLVGLWLSEELDDIADICSDEHQFIAAAKDMLDELNPLSGEASIMSDLISGAISIINWYEIAGHYSEFWLDDDDEDDDDD